MTTKEITCAYCGNKKSIALGELNARIKLNQSKELFCSRACATRFRHDNKTFFKEGSLAHATEVNWDIKDGDIFGDLTVLGSAIKGNASAKICKCACGNILIVCSSDLRKGQKHCSKCFNSWGPSRQFLGQPKELKPKEARKPWSSKEDTAFKRLYGAYRSGAKTRNLEFTLTPEEFKKLTEGNCYYCDTVPGTVYSSQCLSYVYNGVDRVNSDLGYNLLNCVPCCKMCNLKKGTSSLKELYDWIIKIEERKDIWIKRDFVLS